MSDKRRGLGRGLGALIPSSAAANASGNGAAPSRPVDLFFPEARKKTSDAEALPDANAALAKEPESTPVKADDSADLTVDTTEAASAAADAEAAAGKADAGAAAATKKTPPGSRLPPSRRPLLPRRPHPTPASS